MDAQLRVASLSLLICLTSAIVLPVGEVQGQGTSTSTSTTIVIGKSASPATVASPTVVNSATVQAPASMPAAAGELPKSVFASDKPAAGSPEAETEAQQKKAERLQKIQQLTFDRRPSTILRAWASPEDFDKPATPDAMGMGQAQAQPGRLPSRVVGRRVVRATPMGSMTVTTSTSVAPRSAVAIAQPGVVGAPGTDPKAAEAAKVDPFDASLKTFRLNVTLGRWPEVAAFLEGLADDEGHAAYMQLVQSLPNPIFDNMMAPNGMMMNNPNQGPMNPMFMERNQVSIADVIAIAAAAPNGRDKDAIAALGQLLTIAIEQGNAVEDFVARARDAGKLPALDPLSRREAAKLLMVANKPIEAIAFLPSTETAEKEDDREALNLLSRHFLAIHDKEKKAVHLEQAWKVTQAVLAVGKVDREQKDEALKRAVDLAPKIREELGQRWLEESFTKRPDRGMEIVAAIGNASSKGLQTHAQETDHRLKALQLQKTAVEALLKANPNRATDWRESLALLANAWLREAEFSREYDTSTSLGPRMQRDLYGNFFYGNFGMPNMMQQNPNFPQAIAVAQILETMPGDSWTKGLDSAIAPHYASVFAQLYLKVSEEERAFPYIEKLSATHPEAAKGQAEEFLRVWIKNHDPNAEKNMRNPYIYMFGFEQKADGIPLTRSKQQRNLLELSSWVKRLRKLPIGEIDEKLIARAFTTCHSAAEVYRIDAIEGVFGALDALKPDTIAALIQQMRGNLAGLWRAPAVQDQNKTKRKEKDIRAEVLRGYQVARLVTDRGLETHKDHWSLVMARAALMHDENNYRQEIEPSTGFSKARSEALGEFKRAASLYAKKAPTLSEDEESAEVFENWFYAGLGACDIAGITEKTQADPRQPPLIREAILAIAGPSAERHLSKFANDLFTRMTGLNPSVKFRYLKGGFEIVGDHKRAIEARKVYDYYKDLVGEIKLDAVVDGPAEVGSGEPFGLFVNLRHTNEIEREAGGFGKYLQNQNNGNGFFYNYGRPLENYRDKFSEAARKALEEHFDVMSVTFQDEKVNSRSIDGQYGWRYTPYAYLLLKAKSPKVDKIPPLRIDLDFLDTSGYVVLPVESPVVPVDASGSKASSRPFGKMQVTQTLDERQAKEGKLILEVKAVSQGLAPKLDDLATIASPGFEVEKVDDQGLSVSKFDAEVDGNTIVSERTWLVSLKASEGLPKLPETFQFAGLKPGIDKAEMSYQRYNDADLAKVGPVVSLDERYGQVSRAWIGWTAAVLALAVVSGVLAWRFRPRKPVADSNRFQMPETVSAFSVLGLLREIERNNGLGENQKRELSASIADLERHYFADTTAEPPDLKAVAESWLRKTA